MFEMNFNWKVACLFVLFGTSFSVMPAWSLSCAELIDSAAHSKPSKEMKGKIVECMTKMPPMLPEFCHTTMMNILMDPRKPRSGMQVACAILIKHNGLPPGSYLRSHGNKSFVCDSMSSCKLSLNQSYVIAPFMSFFNVKDIANENENLVVEGVVPAGSWTKSCHNSKYIMSKRTLTAYCANKQWVPNCTTSEQSKIAAGIGWVNPAKDVHNIKKAIKCDKGKWVRTWKTVGFFPATSQTKLENDFSSLMPQK